MLGSRVAALCLAAVSAAGCSDESVTFGEREFVSESIEGRTLIPDTRVFVEFDDVDGRSHMSASAGCNYTSGTYELSGGKLLFGSHGISEKGCGGLGDHSAQDAWLVAFLEDPSYELDEPRLVLDDGTVTLVLLDREVADPDRSLQGRVWRVSGLVENGFVLVFGSDVPRSIELDEDGDLAVVTPCAEGHASYGVDGATVEIADAIIAPAVCPDEEFAAEIDSHMREVLADGSVAYEIDAGRLTLMRGDIGLTLSTD